MRKKGTCLTPESFFSKSLALPFCASGLLFSYRLTPFLLAFNHYSALLRIIHILSLELRVVTLKVDFLVRIMLKYWNTDLLKKVDMISYVLRTPHSLRNGMQHSTPPHSTILNALLEPSV